MKNLAKRGPHAVVTSVQQLPTKNMVVTHRVRLSAVLDVLMTDTLSPGASVLKVHCCGIPLCMLLGELCRDHLSWPAGMMRSVCLNLIFRGSHSWKYGRSLGPESMLCQSCLQTAACPPEPRFLLERMELTIPVSPCCCQLFRTCEELPYLLAVKRY